MSVKPLIAGNWKMNGTMSSLNELKAMAVAARDGLTDVADMLICPPATLIARAVETVDGAFAIGAQDCHRNDAGAHTGDIAAGMIADLGAAHVILGHSERRTDHGETSETVHAKVEAAWKAGLHAVICVGESEGEREEGTTLNVLRAQLSGSVPSAASPQNTTIAYEPVWAIGTGRTPTVEDVAKVHGFIREFLVGLAGDEAGRQVRILYGGSVKPSNARELLAVADVDGALVGGASLKADDFIAICRACAA